jgi:hypothetical protein
LGVGLLCVAVAVITTAQRLEMENNGNWSKYGHVL